MKCLSEIKLGIQSYKENTPETVRPRSTISEPCSSSADARNFVSLPQFCKRERAGG